MSKHAKYLPKHRATPTPRLAPRMVRGAVVLGGLAVATTGMSVSGGVLSAGSLPEASGELVDAVAAASQMRVSAEDLEERDRQPVSRSDRRRTDGAVAARAAALGSEAGLAMAATEKVAEGDPREIGRALLTEFGFSAEQFDCLDSLYISESDWRVNADNPSSSAYGIPQALTRLHDLPADYMTSAEAQIRWGLEYIQRSYGSPCNAWTFKQGHGWY